MMKKQYLSIAVALALSSFCVQAETLNNKVTSESHYEVDDLTVHWKSGLTAPSITVKNQLSVSGPASVMGGEVIANGDLTAGSIVTSQGGAITVGGKLTITKNTAKSLQNSGMIKAQELNFAQSSSGIENLSKVQIRTLTGEEANISNSHANAEFVIEELPSSIAGLTNRGAFKVGSAGDVLKVTGDVINEKNGAIITSVNGGAIGLDVGGRFHNQSDLTLTELTVGGILQNDADLSVEGDVTVDTYLSVAEGKTFTVGGDLNVLNTPYDNGETHSLSPIKGNLIVHGNANVATGLVHSTGGLTVDGVLTITGQWFQYQGESSKFNVDHIVMDHQPGRMNSAVLSLEGAGDYHLSKLELKVTSKN